MTVPQPAAQPRQSAGRERTVRTTAAIGAAGVLAALTAGILLLTGADAGMARGFAFAGMVGSVCAGAASVLAQQERVKAVCGIAAFLLLISCSTIIGVSFG